MGSLGIPPPGTAGGFGNRITAMFTGGVETPPLIKGPSGQVHSMEITHAESPSSFVIKAPRKGYGSFRDWRSAFEVYYSANAQSHRLRYPPQVLLMYACFDNETLCWDRVRFLSFVTKDIASVFFYGTCRRGIVPVSSLLELLFQFAGMPLSNFKAELAHIQPAQGSWSKEACQLFNNYVRGKKLDTLIVTSSPCDVGLFKFGVVLKSSDNEKLSLQAILVNKGYATITGPFGTYPELLDIPEAGNKYPNSFYNEIFRVPFPTVRDWEKALRLSEERERVERETQRHGTTKRGKKRAWRMMSDALDIVARKLSCGDWGSSTTILNEGDSSPLSTTIPIEISSLLCRVKITYIHNLAWMYVNIVNRLPLLEKMEDALGGYVESAEPAWEFSPGLPIACLFQKRPRSDENPIWARAVIVSSNHNDNLIKVLMVDYGAEMTVLAENTRVLPESFRTIPSFAHRVFLDANISIGVSWDISSLETFRTQYEALDGSLYALTTGTHFHLSSYSQRILLKGGQWGPQEDIAESHCLDKFRHVHLLSHFFVTRGIQLVYQDTQNRSSSRSSSVFEFNCLLDGVEKN